MNMLENTSINERGLEILKKRNRTNHEICLHVLLVERRRGGPIPRDENGLKLLVIHLDTDKLNNDLSNLKEMSQKDWAKRKSMLKALADWAKPNQIKCLFCKKYDDPINMIVKKGEILFHRECRNANSKDYRRKNPNYFKEYRQRNKEKIKIHEQTPERKAQKVIYNRSYRARLKAKRLAEFKTDMTPIERMEMATSFGVKRKRKEPAVAE